MYQNQKEMAISSSVNRPHDLGNVVFHGCSEQDNRSEYTEYVVAMSEYHQVIPDSDQALPTAVSYYQKLLE